MTPGPERRILDALDRWIVDRPGKVVLAFLVVAAVFAAGLPAVSTDSGTEAFSEDVPEERALQEVNEKFEPAFEPDEGTTQLIQRGENSTDRGIDLHDKVAIERHLAAAGKLGGRHPRRVRCG